MTRLGAGKDRERPGKAGKGRERWYLSDTYLSSLNTFRMQEGAKEKLGDIFTGNTCRANIKNGRGYELDGVCLWFGAIQML